jgi:hypothetical protein
MDGRASPLYLFHPNDVRQLSQTGLLPVHQDAIAILETPESRKAATLPRSCPGAGGSLIDEYSTTDELRILLARGLHRQRSAQPVR